MVGLCLFLRHPYRDDLGVVFLAPTFGPFFFLFFFSVCSTEMSTRFITGSRIDTIEVISVESKAATQPYLGLEG